MEVAELTGDSPEWREFLETNETQIFHTPEWGAFVKKAFPGARHVFMAASEGGKISGIFPFTEVKSAVFGNKLISCAFMDYGGPAGDTNQLEGVFEGIKKRYASSFDYLEVHRGLTDFGSSMERLGMTGYVGGKRFVTQLGNAEELWSRISKQKRKAVRKAEEASLKVKPVERQELKELHKLYLASMKEFGSPPYPMRFFESFYDTFVERGLGRIFGTYHEGELVAVLVGFTYKRRIHIIINVSDKRFWDMRPNDILHWEFLKWGCENAYETFDWGRSRTSVASPPNFFKRMWATTEEDFPHYYMLWKAKKIPNVDPEGPRYRLLVKLWKKLPTLLARSAGARLREGLGV